MVDERVCDHCLDRLVGTMCLELCAQMCVPQIVQLLLFGG